MSQRFSVESELNRIDDGLINDAQKVWGTPVEWFQYDEEASTTDDLYDVGEYRRWKAPLLIPTLWVLREEGVNTYDQEGLYTTEVLQLAVAKSVLRDKLHWVDIDQQVMKFLKDRIRFENQVYTINSFQLQGQLLTRETIIGIQANKVRSDQYRWDPDFTPLTAVGSGLVTAEGSLTGQGDSA